MCLQLNQLWSNVHPANIFLLIFASIYRPQSKTTKNCLNYFRMHVLYWIKWFITSGSIPMASMSTWSSALPWHAYPSPWETHSPWSMYGVCKAPVSVSDHRRANSVNKVNLVRCHLLIPCNRSRICVSSVADTVEFVSLLCTNVGPCSTHARCETYSNRSTFHPTGISIVCRGFISMYLPAQWHNALLATGIWQLTDRLNKSRPLRWKLMRIQGCPDNLNTVLLRWQSLSAAVWMSMYSYYHYTSWSTV